MNLDDLRGAEPGIKTGICWYSPEQWARLREVASDPERLEETYEEWLDMMKRNLRSFRETGLRYELVDIDVEALVRWCRQKGLPVNGSSRADYASRLLQQRHAR